MNGRRESGILLHITSLPSPHGIGDLGAGAYRFVDFLDRAGQTIWQVLPLGPTGYGNSPYQCYSAFGGNPLLVSLEKLAEEGLLQQVDVREDSLPKGVSPSLDRADFDRAGDFHSRALHKAFTAFAGGSFGELRADAAAFNSRNAPWLDDYALFRALKTHHNERAWHQWEADIRDRDVQALLRWQDAHSQEVEYEKFIQFLFFRQWSALKKYANERGISILGDLPIFVAHDSADVWANQELFDLRTDGTPTKVAGVPPDYFSTTGQLWGNPLYRWDRMQENGYAWWIERFRSALGMFDAIRLDHFRGFESYWEVPGDAKTAAGGRWVSGPREVFFEAVQEKLGRIPIIAEDLGVITPQVEALRDRFGFPGMRVLQFAFGDDPKATDYQPHNYPRHCVVYTGTHDNDTTVGWFQSGQGKGSTRAAAQIQNEREFALRYLGTAGEHIQWDMIRLAFSSVADTAIVPMQDVLGLGTQARMNLPGTAEGNWSWRFQWEQLTAQMESKLAELADTYERGKRGLATDGTRNLTDKGSGKAM